MKGWLTFTDDERRSTFHSNTLDLGDIFAEKSVEEVNEIVDSLMHWVKDRAMAKPWKSKEETNNG